MIIILGGANNKNGELHSTTINRLEKYLEIKDNYPNSRVILSGGYRFSKISHCALVKKYLLNKDITIHIEKEFTENNNTIDEAINISQYLSNINYRDNIIIITSPWHLQRAKYLFNITCSDMNINYITYKNIDEENVFISEEIDKLEKLKNAPYGKWYVFLNNLK